jgi:transcriptional regulator with XRE-family HTH domain
MKVNSAFGRVLKKQRIALRLTQRAVAELVGVKGSHIAYLENGSRRPSLELLERIAKTLGLDEKRLFRLAHPEAKGLMGAHEKLAPRDEPQRAWRRFLSDRVLISRYQVTRRELQALKQLSLLGYVCSPREFLAILTLIRSPSDADKAFGKDRDPL